METIEVFALMFCIIVLIKLMTAFFNHGKLLDIAESVFEYKISSALVYFLFLLIISYYLFAEIAFAEIAASMLFLSILIGLSLLSVSDEMLIVIKKMRKKKLKDFWLPITLWLAFTLITIYTIFLQ